MQKAVAFQALISEVFVSQAAKVCNFQNQKKQTQIPVWDGSKGGTANAVGYARSKKVPMVIIDPTKLEIDEGHKFLHDLTNG